MIIVTGSGGPLGFAFKDLYNDDSIYLYPRSFECNLEDFESIVSYTKKKSSGDIHGIIHLAAFSGGAKLSQNRPASMLTKNLRMAINLLEFARINRVKRVLLCLSTTCYSPNLNSPNEDQLHEFPVTGIDYAYSWAKRTFEPLMRAYIHEFQLEVVCVVVNGIVGPNMNFKDDESILPAALIKRFILEKESGCRDFKVLTDGSEIREYTFSYDLAKAVKWCFLNQENGTLLNIGNTMKYSVKEIAYLICDEIGINRGEINFGSKALISRPAQSADNSRFLDISNFEYSDLRLAIKEAVIDFKSRY